MEVERAQKEVSENSRNLLPETLPGAGDDNL